MERLERHVLRYTWKGTALRANIAEDPTRSLPGSRFLKKRIKSDTHAKGAILDTVREMVPEATHCCLNLNICCPKHKDRIDKWTKVCFLGNFTGGDLLIEEPEGLRKIPGSQTRQWHAYAGARDTHWNTPTESGIKYSVICWEC